MRSRWLPVILVLAAVARPVLARPAAVPAVPPFAETAEEVQFDLSPGVFFAVHDVNARAIAASLPFVVAFRHAQLAPDRMLRISVSLDAASPPGTRVSFQPKGSQGGTCRAGSLLPGTSVPVFESTGKLLVTAGSCELLWSLDAFAPPRQAGATPLTLHWKLESVAAAGPAARPSGMAGGTAGGAVDSGFRSGGERRTVAGLPARGERPQAGERPEGAERRRPPR